MHSTIKLSETAIGNILKAKGIVPAPVRAGAIGWKTLMRHYREQLLATDFFVVETIWLKTLYCFFFIELGTRRVYLAGITDHPNGHWVTQQARNTIWLLEEQDTDFVAFIVTMTANLLIPLMVSSNQMASTSFVLLIVLPMLTQ